MQYTIETEINQPRQKVIELFDNPDNLAFWQPGFISFTHESGEPGQPGAVSRIRYDHGKGREFDMIETVTVRNLPKVFSGTFEVPGMMKVEIENFFHERGPDRTLLVSKNDLQFQGFWMKLLGFFIGFCSSNESKKFMDNFKAFCETGADVRKTQA